eukprot:1297111-Pleurochrysis_carterae.AAC.1
MRHWKREKQMKWEARANDTRKMTGGKAHRDTDWQAYRILSRASNIHDIDPWTRRANSTSHTTEKGEGRLKRARSPPVQPRQDSPHVMGTRERPPRVSMRSGLGNSSSNEARKGQPNQGLITPVCVNQGKDCTRITRTRTIASSRTREKERGPK